MNKKIYDKLIKSVHLPDAHIWHITDYEEVLEYLLKENQLLLGGDILDNLDGDYGYESSNWYYQGKSCKESIEIARKYLAEFIELNPNGDYAVEYVFKSELY